MAMGEAAGKAKTDDAAAEKAAEDEAAKKAAEAAEFIKGVDNRDFATAIVLGSGLGSFADELENAVRMDADAGG